MSSIIKVVFPKVVKLGLIFGGPIYEGYIVRDDIMLARERMLGGNAAINAGQQSFSQLVYILDGNALLAFRLNDEVLIQGSPTYSKQEKNITNIISMISPLITKIFN